ncbi:uncharacterized protein LOC112574242 [Pomacea canaliculata]|uniref:uncharacterized protein LOC112574242 n=1 Tax=Pomacea canaliculata TaxID=400727 RepID=UPI000D73906F|nr:uncharacterized protein LOC112574242 [Pomacea canaliculata]
MTLRKFIFLFASVIVKDCAAGAFYPTRPYLMTRTFTIPGNEAHVCDDVAVSRRGSCPDDWTFIADSDGSPCLQLMNLEVNFDNANAVCSKLGGHLLHIRSAKRQQAVEKFLSSNSDSALWIGLKMNSSNRFNWVGTHELIPLTYLHTDDYQFRNPSNYHYYGSLCGYLLSQNKKWHTSRCSDQRKFICEGEQECDAGVFGDNCDQVCHCYGEECKGGQACKYGCEQGWMGPYCCTRKRKADIIYYCANSASDGRYLLVRINPFGVAYDNVQMLDESGNAVPWCNGTTFPHDTHGTYSIKISLSDGIEDIMGSTCAGNKTGNNSFEWLLSLEEKRGVFLPLDRRVRMSCDFNKAESMARAQRPGIFRESSETEKKHLAPHLEKPADSQEDVVLEVSDPFSGEALSKAQLGAGVRLQMALSVSAGLTAKGVSPYRCEASSGDGEHTQQLTDDRGCSTFIVSPLRRQNATESVKSEPFQLFTFPGYDYIVITCAFQFCFTPGDPLCDDRCKTKTRPTYKFFSTHFNWSRQGYDDEGFKRRKRDVIPPRKASTFIYVIRDEQAAGQQEARTILTMGPAGWSLLAVVVVVSSALVYVLVAKKRADGRHRRNVIEQQRQQASLLTTGSESAEEGSAL